MSTVFHNTIKLTGEDLKKAVANCRKQEDAILKIYFHTRDMLTASDIHKLLEKAGFRHPITSTRRGITNLFNARELIKTSDSKQGLYDKPEHFYRINHVKYPTPTQLEQAELF
jgi:hypothetical protein